MTARQVPGVEGDTRRDERSPRDSPQFWFLAEHLVDVTCRSG